MKKIASACLLAGVLAAGQLVVAAPASAGNSWTKVSYDAGTCTSC